MQDLDKQLKKGVLAIVILKLIGDEDRYGYDLMKTMDEKSGGFYEVREGSLYPVLYRLEDQGLVKCYRKEGGTRSVPRKYYSITEIGKKALVEQIEQWNTFKLSTEQLLSKEE